MHRGEEGTSSAAAQTGGSEAPRAPSVGGMSYSPTSPAESPRNQESPESAEGFHPEMMMAGSQDKNQMETPRGQALPAKTQTNEVASASSVSKRLMSESVRPRGHSQRRWTERADRMAMMQTGTMIAEMLMLAK